MPSPTTCMLQFFDLHKHMSTTFSAWQMFASKNATWVKHSQDYFTVTEKYMYLYIAFGFLVYKRILCEKSQQYWDQQILNIPQNCLFQQSGGIPC